MRRLMGVSILALSLALTTSAHAEEWFRLRMGAPVLYGDGADGPPDMGGNNPIEIMVEAQSSARAYGAVTIVVIVTGIDGTYTVDVIDRPPEATWDGDAIQWTSAVEGTYTPTIEVRDGNGILVSSQDLELTVYGPLTASTPQTSYEVDVGDALTITPTAANAIGDLQWGSTPSELPEWLEFDSTTGAINVDTSTAQHLEDIVLTTVDQGDFASASTLPLSIAVYGSEWLSTFGGSSTDQGHSMAMGSDGAVYVTGRTSSAGAGGNDAFLAKYDVSGTLQWQRTLEGNAADIANEVAVGPDGSVYVTGYTVSVGAGSYDLLLAKYNTSGALQWQRLLGGANADYGNSIGVGSDGSIYIGGYTISAGAGGSDALLVKYSASGALQWQRTLGGNNADTIRSIAIGNDGSVYVTGYTVSVGAGSNDVLLVKYNASGALQWQRMLGGSGIDQGNSIAIGSDGTVYVGGNTASAGAGSNDVLLVKYNASGTLQWQRTLGGSASDIGTSAAISPDGSVYVGGSTASAGAGDNDGFIARFSAAGTLHYQRTLGGSINDDIQSIAIGSDGFVYVGGSAASGGAGFDAMLAKLPMDEGDDMIAGPFTYQSSNLSSQTSTLATGASTLSTGTPNLTSSSSTLSEGTPSLSSTTTKFKVQ